jgi:hypothetical protein
MSFGLNPLIFEFFKDGRTSIFFYPEVENFFREVISLPFDFQQKGEQETVTAYNQNERDRLK